MKTFNLLSMAGIMHLKKPLFKIASVFTLLIFLVNTVFPLDASAQMTPMAPLSSAVSLSEQYRPAVVSGITIHPDNPLQFDFLIDSGDSGLNVGNGLKPFLTDEIRKLINYFLATLTVPDDEMWVNLSPYEKDRIIADGLSQTEMGRDMLAQDFLLKQLTAVLMSPEGEAGKKFWERVYEQIYNVETHDHASLQNDGDEIQNAIESFNKVWIVPEQASVYVHDNNVFVVNSHLKVMLEEDYLAQARHSEERSDEESQSEILRQKTPQDDSVKSIIRQTILPIIEQEINEGQTFANLRQIYNSMILATWYKKNLKRSLLGQVYFDQNKVEGIDLAEKDAKEKIYNQYVAAFQSGAYDSIKEEYDPATQQIIPKKYFSGGLTKVGSLHSAPLPPNGVHADFAVLVNAQPAGQDPAMLLARYKEPDFEGTEFPVMFSKEDIEREIKDVQQKLNFQTRFPVLGFFIDANFNAIKDLWLLYMLLAGLAVTSSYAVHWSVGIIFMALVSFVVPATINEAYSKSAYLELRKLKQQLKIFKFLQKHYDAINTTFLNNRENTEFIPWMKQAHSDLISKVISEPAKISIFQIYQLNQAFKNRPGYRIELLSSLGDKKSIIREVEMFLPEQKRLDEEGIERLMTFVQSIVILTVKQNGHEDVIGYASPVDDNVLARSKDNTGGHVIDMDNQKVRIVTKDPKDRDKLLSVLKQRLQKTRQAPALTSGGEALSGETPLDLNAQPEVLRSGKSGDKGTNAAMMDAAQLSTTVKINGERFAVSDFIGALIHIETTIRVDENRILYAERNRKSLDSSTSNAVQALATEFMSRHPDLEMFFRIIDSTLGSEDLPDHMGYYLKYKVVNTQTPPLMNVVNEMKAWLKEKETSVNAAMMNPLNYILFDGLPILPSTTSQAEDEDDFEAVDLVRAAYHQSLFSQQQGRLADILAAEAIGGIYAESFILRVLMGQMTGGTLFDRLYAAIYILENNVFYDEEVEVAQKYLMDVINGRIEATPSQQLIAARYIHGHFSETDEIAEKMITQAIQGKFQGISIFDQIMAAVYAHQNEFEIFTEGDQIETFLNNLYQNQEIGIHERLMSAMYVVDNDFDEGDAYEFVLSVIQGEVEAAMGDRVIAALFAANYDEEEKAYAFLGDVHDDKYSDIEMDDRVSTAIFWSQKGDEETEEKADAFLMKIINGEILPAAALDRVRAAAYMKNYNESAEDFINRFIWESIYAQEIAAIDKVLKLAVSGSFSVQDVTVEADLLKSVIIEKYSHKFDWELNRLFRSMEADLGITIGKGVSGGSVTYARYKGLNKFFGRNSEESLKKLGKQIYTWLQAEKDVWTDPAMMGYQLNIETELEDFSKQRPGGIDFDSAQMNLQESGEKLDFDFSNIGMDPAQMQNLRGLKPVIINIVPVTPAMLNRLLGRSESKEPSEDEQAHNDPWFIKEDSLL